MSGTVEMVFLGEDHEPIWEQDWPNFGPRVGEVVCLAERTVDAFDLPTCFWRVIYVQHDLAHDAPPLVKRVLLEDNDAKPPTDQDLGAAITDPGEPHDERRSGWAR